MANPEQLNEKIAEWLGWKIVKCRDINHVACKHWTKPEGLPVHHLPNFTTSQDTHGPIIEKLRNQHKCFEMRFQFYKEGIRCILVNYPHYLGVDVGPTPALAFCLAVEKIIDVGE